MTNTNEKTMTAREFYSAIVACEGSLPTEIVEFAQAQIEKLDLRNESRKTSKSALAKQAEGAEIADKVVEFLGACGCATAEVIASEIGYAKGKVVYQLTALVKAGTVEKSKAKSKDPYIYTLVTTDGE